MTLNHAPSPTPDLLHAALDSIAAHVAILDEQGIIVFVNAAWRRFGQTNGYRSLESGVGSSYLEICAAASPGDAPEAAPVAAAIRDVLSGQLPDFYIEYPCFSPDFRYWFQLRIARFSADGQNYAVLVHENITEIKLAEERLRAQGEQLAHLGRLQVAGQTAAGLAHELGQPLSAIVNYARGCARRLSQVAEMPQEIFDALEQISAQANRAANIVRSTRTFVQKAAPAQVNLNDLVRQALQLTELEARAGKVQVRLELAPEMPWTSADPLQVEQVIVNLIRNAIQAMVEASSPRRVITVTTSVGPGEKLRLEVADSGPGIPDEHLSRIFEPFFTTRADGVGLGLSISRGIIERCGGRLEAASSPRGATFSFTLALRRGPQPQV